jgi:hypothetical protein
MNPEQQQSIQYFGNERRTFTRDEPITLELEYLREQMLQTTCQEIADLYTMLRHKCLQDELALEFAHYPAQKVQIH